MSEQNKSVLRRAYEIFTTGNLDALDAITAANFVDHNPSPGQAPGLEGTKQMITGMRAAFPDLTITAEDMIAEGDKVVAHVRMQGTHKGEFMGIPPTGKRVTVMGFDMLRIVGGKAVERWGEFDNLGMMQQLGVIPAQR